MLIFIEPLSKIFIDGKVYDGERVKDKLFGGFCECGGLMFQKIWANVDGRNYLISECEKCWKNEVMEFNNVSLIERTSIEVVDRANVTEFIGEFLTEAELGSIRNKVRGKDYNYNAFSRAKKKLEEIGLDYREIAHLI
ncbi:hypothetical protein DRP05_14705 [Archaeoglobales archaeon]|nr:MAG: hypothetical protein DRP05_14705 [Archaeoglobales archaeon]